MPLQINELYEEEVKYLHKQKLCNLLLVIII